MRISPRCLRSTIAPWSWLARWRATGSLVPRPRGGGWACPIDMEVLLATVRGETGRDAGGIMSAV